MSDVVSPLLTWLHAHPQLAGLVTFIISAAESVAIIGTIVPGSIMMTGLGTLAGAGVIPLYETLFWATLGAIVGDGISYWFGHYFKNRLKIMWPFRRNPSLLMTGEIYFYKYGSMSVFIGRFVGPVRALVPLVAGMLGMKPLQFIIANVTSAILWAPAYMLPGILLGAASLELPPDIAIHVMLVLSLMSLFVMLCLYFIYKIFLLVQRQIDQIQSSAWRKIEKSAHFSKVALILKHHDPLKTYGQFNWAILFLITAIGFLILAIMVKITGPGNIGINDAIYHLFRGLSFRSEALDHLLIKITLFGQKEVIMPIVLALIAYFLIIHRRRLALHVLALGILTAGSIFVLKHLFKIPRPEGIVYNPETYSMPSGHSTLAAVTYIGLALLISTRFRRHYKPLILGIGITIAATISLSRLYLGAHWFTDVVGSFLLASALLTFITISYQRKKEQPINAMIVLFISIIALAVSYTVYYKNHFLTLTQQYKQTTLPIVVINHDQWWNNQKVLDGYQVSLFGVPAYQINLQWAGDLNAIWETLLSQGWTRPPARNLVSTLHRVADIESTAYLPLISPQYLDQQPKLIMTRYLNHKKGLLTIRLWNSNRIISETKQPIWVGVLSIVPRSFSWIYHRNASQIDINTKLLFPHLLPTAWQWKFLQPLTRSKDPNANLKIMFIQPKDSSSVVQKASP